MDDANEKFNAEIERLRECLYAGLDAMCEEIEKAAPDNSKPVEQSSVRELERMWSLGE